MQPHLPSYHFKEWPKSLPVKPEDLADAGFFYTGRSDKTLCFYCGGGLRDWKIMTIRGRNMPEPELQFHPHRHAPPKHLPAARPGPSTERRRPPGPGPTQRQRLPPPPAARHTRAPRGPARRRSPTLPDRHGSAPEARAGAAPTGTGAPGGPPAHGGGPGPGAAPGPGRAPGAAAAARGPGTVAASPSRGSVSPRTDGRAPAAAPLRPGPGRRAPDRDGSARLRRRPWGPGTVYVWRNKTRFFDRGKRLPNDSRLYCYTHKAQNALAKQFHVVWSNKGLMGTGDPKGSSAVRTHSQTTRRGFYVAGWTNVHWKAVDVEDESVFL
ncbi:E3 ubiquitin-protein ligase IAP-3 [Eumeta japonica]|uniref:E3 ubiquitin-protein ligase IAP-3 n=1 Tax=Eumeta variegata TaxID=151549 RepID=A0A4C1TUV8_EUMVA|nr:E3 ubiquitin-protein ligase IAP-3 [Eumeta japonica]